MCTWSSWLVQVQVSALCPTHHRCKLQGMRSVYWGSQSMSILMLFFAGAPARPRCAPRSLPRVQNSWPTSRLCSAVSPRHVHQPLPWLSQSQPQPQPQPQSQPQSQPQRRRGAQPRRHPCQLSMGPSPCPRPLQSPQRPQILRARRPQLRHHRLRRHPRTARRQTALNFGRAFLSLSCASLTRTSESPVFLLQLGGWSLSSRLEGGEGLLCCTLTCVWPSRSHPTACCLARTPSFPSCVLLHRLTFAVPREM